MKERSTDVCRRCGSSDVVVRNGEGDPLQVSECATCGSIRRIGGHQW